MHHTELLQSIDNAIANLRPTHMSGSEKHNYKCFLSMIEDGRKIDALQAMRTYIIARTKAERHISLEMESKMAKLISMCHN